MENEHPLRLYRDRAGLSLEELANACGSTRATLSRIENGLQNPSLALIERIRDATCGAVRADDFLPFRGVATEGFAEAPQAEGPAVPLASQIIIGAVE
jgi:transcriptional regulator with XRE-family HTH domain